jgi:hypothetical protein
VIVEIDHAVTWRKRVQHEVDEDLVRDCLNIPIDEPITREHLVEYFEGDVECGDPVSWVPNDEYGEGYECHGIEVWDVTSDAVPEEEREAIESGRHVEIVKADPQYV